jgi:cupin fold WbuC family metalloprotein
MLKFKKESSKVLYAKQGIITLDKKNLNFLLKLSKKNKDKVIRLCTHKNKKDVVHEMIIIHPKKYKCGIHMHSRNAEAMTIIKGRADVVIFNKNRKVKKIIKMGDMSSNRVFYYKIPKKVFHTLIIKSPYLIFYEVSKGPFTKKKNFYPTWANQLEIK